MTSSPDQILQELHNTYCTLTSTEPKFMVWQRSWFSFWQMGYTKSDLECVLKWILRENRRNDYKRSFSLLKLLADDFQVFDSYLSEARAVERNHKPVTPKQQVVREFRRCSEEEIRAASRTISQIIGDMKR